MCMEMTPICITFNIDTSMHVLPKRYQYSRKCIITGWQHHDYIRSPFFATGSLLIMQVSTCPMDHTFTNVS